jgi:NarL family two-component system response regulator LiaR
MAQAAIASRFELGPLIGGGATGAVFVGLDTLTGEKVVVKALRRELIAGMPELVERFLREGEALRRLNHPNIVKVLAAANEGDQHYLVMEYVGGGSLADLLQREPKLPIDRAVSIALELADALSRAHHLDILHRDIKPANILLAEDGTPRLTDFGLARLGSCTPLTTAGSILGTFYYLSPEACYNDKLDGRTDIWSFGVVLYEMLTGQLPFTGDSPVEILWAIKNQPLPDPCAYRKDIPAGLAQLVCRMLMKDRVARISSVRLVGAELELIQKRRKAEGPVMDEGASKQDRPAFKEAGWKDRPETPSFPTVTPQKIRVLVVDDHAVVRQGLRTFIDLQEDMEVVGEGSNGAEGVRLSEHLQPDVILLDLVMPEMDGVEATRQILACSPHTHILILTSFGEDDKVFPAVRAGAQGYLLKDIHPNDLVEAVRAASQGKAQLHPEIAKKLMAAVAADRGALASGAQTAEVQAYLPAELGVLTDREIEVLRLIARGLSNHAIAETMVISEKTVKTHVSNLLGKLGVEDRTQAAIWALKHGLGAED